MRVVRSTPAGSWDDAIEAAFMQSTESATTKNRHVELGDIDILRNIMKVIIIRLNLNDIFCGPLRMPLNGLTNSSKFFSTLSQGIDRYRT